MKRRSTGPARNRPVHELEGAVGVAVINGPRGAIRIEWDESANVRVATTGDVTVQNEDAVPSALSAFDQTDALAGVAKRVYRLGDVLPDGWIVGPISPDTGQPMAIEPAESALDGCTTWRQGQRHADELLMKGNGNVRLPSASELKAIYNHIVSGGRDANAKLSASDSNPFGTYWSGTTHPDNRDLARLQYLDNGDTYWDFKDFSIARVRCVRDEPGLRLAFS